MNLEYGVSNNAECKKSLFKAGLENILYKRVALTTDSKTITIYKFRTMVIDADKRLNDIIDQFGVNNYGKPTVDPRITKVGKILRRYWIDEIPQLYSLVKGDLKLIGIRPRSSLDWERYPIELKELALNQKPALVSVMYASPVSPNFEDQINFERKYLDEWMKQPICTDLKYLYRVVVGIIFKGIRSE